RPPIATAALALTVGLAAAPGAHAAGSGTADAFRSGLASLAGRVADGAAPSSVHGAKRALIDDALSDTVGGVSAALVVRDLDCISVAVQRARSGRRTKTRMNEAKRCRDDLAAAAGAGGAQGLLADL